MAPKWTVAINAKERTRVSAPHLRRQHQLQARRCGRSWFPVLAKDARNGVPILVGVGELKINVRGNGQECPLHAGHSCASEQQVPPLRRRWRSCSGRNDKTADGREAPGFLGMGSQSSGLSAAYFGERD